jgi:hypothetical protein
MLLSLFSSTEGDCLIESTLEVVRKIKKSMHMTENLNLCRFIVFNFHQSVYLVDLINKKKSIVFPSPH